MKKLFLLAVFLTPVLALAQAKPVYNIGVLLDKELEDFRPRFEQFKTEVKAVVGEGATIRFPESSVLVNNFDLDKAAQNYQTLLDNETDIIIALGVINGAVVVKQTEYPKPTILFGAINQDMNQIDFTNKTSGISNFTYLVNTESYVEDLKMFKELTDFKRLGVVVEAPLLQFLPFEETFTKATADLEASHQMIPYNTVSDITSRLDEVDALYIAGGFFLKEAEVKDLAQALAQRKIPSFTTNGIRQVNAGLMATAQADDNTDRFFRRLALTVDGYIGGTPLSEMPVLLDYESRLTINYNTAALVGIPIKFSLIGTTDFVGEFKNVLSEKQYNLLDVINQSLDNNLALQATRKDVLLSEQDLKSARTNYLPALTAAGGVTHNDPDLAAVSNGQSPEFQTAGNLSLEQVVYSEGANANISIQKHLLEAQKANLNAEQLNKVLESSNAYFTTLIVKANAQIIFQNLDLTRKNLAIAEENFNAGQSGKSDMLRFRSQLAQNTQSMIEALNQLEQSFIQLNQVMNNPLDFEIDVEEAQLGEGVFEEYNYGQLTEILDNPLLRESIITFLVEEAKNNSPELKQLDYNLAAIDRNIRFNKTGRYYPTVALSGQYINVFDRSGAGSEAPPPFQLIDNYYTVGLNLSVPILNRNQTNINLQTATIQKEQLDLNTANTELAIATNIRTNVLNLINQISNIELSKVSEETAKEALELTQLSYSKGAVNVIQLIDAQNNYLSAQLARNNAIYNFLLSAIQLERSMGYFFLLKTKEENAAFNQRFLQFNSTQE